MLTTSHLPRGTDSAPVAARGSVGTIAGVHGVAQAHDRIDPARGTGKVFWTSGHTHTHCWCLPHILTPLSPHAPPDIPLKALPDSGRPGTVHYTVFPKGETAG